MEDLRPTFLLRCLCLLLCLLSLHAGSGRGCGSPRAGAAGAHCDYGAREGSVVVRRRKLQAFRGGPGSYPPRCMAKCGGCTPCRAVHVPVPPGRAVIAEYYPEAWRCKCGNRLYLP